MKKFEILPPSGTILFHINLEGELVVERNAMEWERTTSQIQKSRKPIMNKLLKKYIGCRFISNNSTIIPYFMLTFIMKTEH